MGKDCIGSGDAPGPFRATVSGQDSDGSRCLLCNPGEVAAHLETLPHPNWRSVTQALARAGPSALERGLLSVPEAHRAAARKKAQETLERREELAEMT